MCKCLERKTNVENIGIKEVIIPSKSIKIESRNSNFICDSNMSQTKLAHYLQAFNKSVKNQVGKTDRLRKNG